MIDGEGGIGPRHWKGRRGRRKAEKWIEKMVKNVRKVHSASDETIFKFFSFHKDPEENYLPKEIVTVEILNLIAL